MKKTHKLFFLILTIFGLVFSLGIFFVISTQKVDALSGSQFDPGRIIDDAIFYQSNSMSAAQVQTFLNSKVPTCDTNGTLSITYYYNSSTKQTSFGYFSGGSSVTTSRAVFGQRYANWYNAHPYSSYITNESLAPYTCLKTYTQNTTEEAAQSGICGYMPARSGQNAANIIAQVAAACGISPKVLIVLIQKEQGLVTDDWPWAYEYREATGYGCPDTSGCDSKYYGFFNQVYDAAWQFKMYNANPYNYSYVAGQNNNILYNPNTACGKKTVYIQDVATASLYNYTPYVPNAAALKNVSTTSDGGVGDSCSSYGNRNFWWYYNVWFGSTQTSTLFKVNGNATIYLDWGGNYYPVPSPMMLTNWGLNGITPRIVSSLPSGETEGPLLSDAAKFGSDNTIYLVEGGKRHAAPNWATLNAFGITSNTNYPSSLGWVLQDGGLLTTVARAPSGSIFLIQNDKKRGFPDWTTFSTLSGPNYAGTTQVYSQQTRTNMSAAYLGNIVEGAPMLLDGRFIKASGNASIYLYDNGQKLPFSPAAYAAWGKRLDYNFSQTAISQIPDGSLVPVLASSGGGIKYLIDGGKKEAFSASLEATWGLNDSDFTQMTDGALARLGSSNASDLIRLPSGAIFTIQNGQRHGIPSMSDFNKLGYSWSNVDNVSNSTSSIVPNGAILFAPGDLLRTPNGAVHVVNSGYEELGITYGALFSRFGYSWSNVRNVDYYVLNGYTENALQTLLKSNSDGKYYEIDMGVKHYVDSTTFSNSDYDMASWANNQVDPGILNGIKTGAQLTQFIRGSSPTVYYVQNGQRHGITSSAKFYGLGGSWDKVVKVSDAFLSEIPNGSII